MNFQNKQKKQQGLALVMSLIMLLVITIIGVASVRGSKIDTQVAGNSMFALMVFQGAESALGKVASNKDLSNVRDAALARDGDPVDIPESYLPDEQMNDATLITTAEMKFESDYKGSLFNSDESSIDFEYQIFRTTATSKLDATGAKAVHIEGFAIQKP